MAAARGDTKPCSVPKCAGTMQYGRRASDDADSRPMPRPGDRAATDNVNGWNCSAAHDHFRQQ